MSFSGNTIVNSFRKQLLEAKHDFRTGNHTFKLALFSADATLNADTTNYSTTNEVTGTGYSAGGAVLTTVSPALSGGRAIVDFADLTFSTVTLSVRGALIYNTTTDGGAGTTDAVMVLDFGRVITKTAANLVIVMPTPDQINALLRL
jgi:hypothetical protein